MITWIQKTFHEHFRFVFITLLVVSIVAFIFVNNASLGLGLFQPHREKRLFFGINLAESGAVERIQRDASTSIFFQFGSAPPKNEHLRRLSYKRHALIFAADQMSLPQPPAGEIEKHIKTMRYFRGESGRFDPAKYTNFQISPMRATGLDITLRDFMRATGDDLRMDHLQKLISGPGYVLPSEVRQIIRQNETVWTLISADVDCQGALASIDASESQVADYFENNRAKYTTAPMVRVDYIEFPSSLFLKSVKVTEDEVRAYYDANPARFPKSLAIANTPQSHNQNYELVRPNAEALLRQQRAQALASTAASELALELHKGRIFPDTREFDELLEKNHVSIKSLPAFSKDAPPEQFGRNGAAAARESFTLNDEARYSNPVKTGQGAVILVWRESIPQRPAEFSEVAKKAGEDHINEERKKQVQAIGKKIKHRVETDLKAGLPFQVAITKAAVGEGAGVTTKNHAPFSLRQPGAKRQGGADALDIDRNLTEILQHLEQGRMSEMIINGGAGRFIYARDVKLADFTETNPEHIRIERDMAARRASATFDAFAQSLVDSELEKSQKQQGH